MIVLFKIIILGVVEGLTEFIPVSSTGHLILAKQLLQAEEISNVFEIAIQLGAILAIILFYHQRLFKVLFSLHNKPESRSFVINVFYAWAPAIVFGALFHKFIKSILFSPLIISATLILGGIGILIVEKIKPPSLYTRVETIPRLTALIIGLFQVLAMVPGVSRSGATIMGALLLKLDRKTATEFSFFLAIPTILSAIIFDLYKNYEVLAIEDLKTILLGIVCSFVSSILVIRLFIAFISRHKFTVFAYYRIVVGILMLFYFVFL